MNLSDRNRRLLLSGAALATVLAVIFAPPAEEPVQPVRTASDSAMPAQQEGAASRSAEPAAMPAQAAPAGGLVPLKRSGLKNEPGDLFQVDRPPSPKPTGRPAAPPRPVAPPLPYVYMGKMIENSELTVFLTRQDKPYVVHAGDVLDSQYRVDAIHPPLLEFTYLPLKQKQTLNIGVSK